MRKFFHFILLTYFDFVYPITLSYNNGTTITVTSYEGLIEVLTSENENLYIEGISFPFQIVLASDGSIITINNEDEFWEVLDSLEIETMDDYRFPNFLSVSSPSPMHSMR